MKKLIAIVLSLVLIAAFYACGSKAPEQEAEVISEETANKEVGLGIALVCGAAGADSAGYGKSAKDGILEYIEENSGEDKGEIAFEIFTASSDTEEELSAVLRSACESGVGVVVTAGKGFESAIDGLCGEYPDISFVISDDEPKAADTEEGEGIYENVAYLVYEVQESGYLAGYAAVSDGNTKLAFLCERPEEEDRAYGYGFIQGAEAAASDLGLGEDDVRLVFYSTGVNRDENELREIADQLYREGVAVIFASGERDFMLSADAASGIGGKTIGVDFDRRAYNESVLTSAIKGIAPSVKAVLEALRDGSFASYGGSVSRFGAKSGGAGLALDTEEGAGEDFDPFDRFISFNLDEYNVQLQRLSDGSVVPLSRVVCSDEAGYATADEIRVSLGLSKVAVEVRR